MPGFIKKIFWKWEHFFYISFFFFLYKNFKPCKTAPPAPTAAPRQSWSSRSEIRDPNDACPDNCDQLMKSVCRPLDIVLLGLGTSYVFRKHVGGIFHRFSSGTPPFSRTLVLPSLGAQNPLEIQTDRSSGRLPRQGENPSKIMIWRKFSNIFSLTLSS